MGKIARIEEVCPIYKIENDCIISKNGDLTIGFEITLPEIWTISAFDYDEIHKTWASAIQNLPDYTIVHKQDIYYDAAYKYEGKQETFLQKSYARHFDGRKYLKHRCYLFFTKSNKRVFSSMTVKTSPLTSRLIPQEQLGKKEVAEFEREVKRLVSVFKVNTYMGVRQLAAEDYVGTSEPERFGLMDLYANLSFGREDKLTLNDLHIEDGTLMVGDKYVSVHSVAEQDQLPERSATYEINQHYSTNSSDKPMYVYNGFGSRLGERLGFEHIYNQYFFV